MVPHVRPTFYFGISGHPLSPESMMRISKEMPDLNTLHEAVHTSPVVQRRCPTKALIPGCGETRIEKRIDAMELDWVTSLNPRARRQTD